MKTSADDSAAADGRPVPHPFLHEGMRAWQDRFDSRRLADRLEERLGRKRFTVDDRTFIESSTMFFLATTDEAELQSRRSKQTGIVHLEVTH